jgi:hypothetical protein
MKNSSIIINICIYRERTVAEDGAHKGPSSGVTSEAEEADGRGTGLSRRYKKSIVFIN